MLTLEEYKNRYSKELDGLTENEVIANYNIYLEDPLEYNADMIN